MKTHVVLSFFHFVLVYFIFPIISRLPSLNEKGKINSIGVHLPKKIENFEAFSLVYFINHKPLIFEEWHIHSNNSLFKRLNFYLQKKNSLLQFFAHLMTSDNIY